MQLDKYDLKILEILQRDGRITKSALAEEICLSTSPCWERVRRLEIAGIIQGYGARINSDLLQPSMPIIMEIELSKHSAEAFQKFESVVGEAREVIECYATGGQIDYILRVATGDIDEYQRLVDSWLMADLYIERYYTYIVTKKIKSGSISQQLTDVQTSEEKSHAQRC